MNALALTPPGAACALHPERAASDSCSRCGKFICGEDRTVLHQRVFCPECHARPDVNYLEAFRLQHWGKRDGWAWISGIGAVFFVALLAMSAFEGRVWNPVFLGLLFGAVISGCYFFGLRWARLGIIAAQLLPGLVMFALLLNAMVFGSVEEARAAARDIPSVLAGYFFSTFIPLAVSIAIYFDTRNRLFFKIPVSEKRLRSAWNLFSNNTLARSGFLLSLLGLIVPGVAIPAAICSGIGLSRVDPDALPPIGRRGQAIAGLVFSAIGVVAWGTFFVTTWL